MNIFKFSEESRAYLAHDSVAAHENHTEAQTDRGTQSKIATAAFQSQCQFRHKDARPTSVYLSVCLLVPSLRSSIPHPRL